jgi:hypothetical protein
MPSLCKEDKYFESFTYHRMERGTPGGEINIGKGEGKGEERTGQRLNIDEQLSFTSI